MCHNFIFGYGSLINAESRAITGVSGEVIPLKVTGVRREWGHIISVAKITGLNLVENPGSWCNGVLASIDETELLNFDQREDDGGYRRILLEENKITGLPKEFSGEKIWVYVGKNSKPMTENAPIIQSYIDVAMSGCLSFGENFAREFVISTYRWDTPWVNDRLNPIYPRAMKEVPPRRNDRQNSERRNSNSIFFQNKPLTGQSRKVLKRKYSFLPIRFVDLRLCFEKCSFTTEQERKEGIKNISF